MDLKVIYIYIYQSIYLLLSIYLSSFVSKPFHHLIIIITIAIIVEGGNNVEMLWNYRHPDINHSSRNNQKISLDIFIPSLNLAVEYHGMQHYQTMGIFGNNSDRKKRDTEKRELCSRYGITLIEIPFWWDGKIDSLAATIRDSRSDLVPRFTSSTATSIPTDMPIKEVQRLERLQGMMEYIIPSLFFIQ